MGFDVLKYTSRRNLGVAQLVARYLGVVEAARSSRVTQTNVNRKAYDDRVSPGCDTLHMRVWRNWQTR